jgi:hypothetical protein
LLAGVWETKTGVLNEEISGGSGRAKGVFSKPGALLKADTATAFGGHSLVLALWQLREEP